MMPPPEGFAEPWHAQLFALTVAMSEAGHFQWTDWTEAFGATLARRREGGALDGTGDYYGAWLETLEGVLCVRGIAAEGYLDELRLAWEQAYLRTPHGRPVTLGS